MKYTMPAMEIDKIIKNAAGIIRNHLTDDYKIFLFGSWAKGDALDGSDIDIGVLGRDMVPWDAMVKILNDIDGIPTLRKIEVVDLNSTGQNFRGNVLSYAKSLM